MKKYIFVLIIIFFVFDDLQAQKQISNIRLEHIEAKKKIRIYYDIKGLQATDSLAIKIEAPSLTKKPTLLGDLGIGTMNGTNRMIEWDVMTDGYNAEESIVVSFLIFSLPVITKTTIPPSIKPSKKLKKIPMGIGTGLAALSFGLANNYKSTYNKALTNLEIIQSNADSDKDKIILTAALYKQYDEAYQKADIAKSKKGLSNTLLAVGLVGLAFDTYALIHNRKTKQKKISLFPSINGNGLSLLYHLK